VTAPAIGAGLAATRAAETANAPASETALFPLFAISTQNLLEGATCPEVGHATRDTSETAAGIANARLYMAGPSLTRSSISSAPPLARSHRPDRFSKQYQLPSRPRRNCTTPSTMSRLPS